MYGHVLIRSSSLVALPDARDITASSQSVHVRATCTWATVFTPDERICGQAFIVYHELCPGNTSSNVVVTSNVVVIVVVVVLRASEYNVFKISVWSILI